MRTQAASASSIVKTESPRAGRRNLPKAAALNRWAPQHRASKEFLMVFRSARRIRVAAAFIALSTAFIICFALLQPARAQTGPAKPQGQPAAPAPSPVAPEGIQTKPGDAFGEEVTLTAKPIVYVKGTGA